MQVNWKVLWKEFNVWHDRQEWPTQARKIRQLVFDQGEISATFNWKKIWRSLSKWVKEHECPCYYGGMQCPSWKSQQKQIRIIIEQELQNAQKTSCC